MNEVKTKYIKRNFSRTYYLSGSVTWDWEFKLETGDWNQLRVKGRNKLRCQMSMWDVWCESPLVGLIENQQLRIPPAYQNSNITSVSALASLLHWNSSTAHSTANSIAERERKGKQVQAQRKRKDESDKGQGSSRSEAQLTLWKVPHSFCHNVSTQKIIKIFTAKTKLNIIYHGTSHVTRHTSHAIIYNYNVTLYISFVIVGQSLVKGKKRNGRDELRVRPAHLLLVLHRLQVLGVRHLALRALPRRHPHRDPLNSVVGERGNGRRKILKLPKLWKVKEVLRPRLPQGLIHSIFITNHNHYPQNFWLFIFNR